MPNFKPKIMGLYPHLYYLLSKKMFFFFLNVILRMSNQKINRRYIRKFQIFRSIKELITLLIIILNLDYSKLGALGYFCPSFFASKNNHYSFINQSFIFNLKWQIKNIITWIIVNPILIILNKRLKSIKIIISLRINYILYF